MNKEGTELARFDEEVTMPKTSKTLLVNEIDGMTFSVSLKKKPRTNLETKPASCWGQDPGSTSEVH